jgi:hypothetical protein
MINTYILDENGEPQPARDTLEWARWLETAHEKRIIQQTVVSESPYIWVSTMFLGLDHNVTGKGAPLIFETMVFRDSDGAECWRYATRAEAVAGHARAVDEVRSGSNGRAHAD